MQAQINTSNIVSAVPLPSTEKIEITTGDAALRLIQDQAFIREWDILYKACPWATVFQSKEFATIWYKLFRGRFTPVIVSSWHNENLTGLILLAQNGRDKKIKGAGGDLAYYQTWLTSEPSNAFIKTSLRELIVRFPGHIISLIQLPPTTPISWIESDLYFRKICTLKTIPRPLVNLKDQGIDKLLKKKDFRERCNRLKRLGKLTYERIEDPEKFASTIDELALQYDFRQGATRNWTPFRNNPLRKQLLVEMFNQNMLHVTLLKLNNEIIASLIATQGRDNWMHGVGLNCHSPFYASNSPGFVCFVKFIQMLTDEGYDILDLTTGKQPYKERLANRHDRVYELTVTDKSIPVAKEILKAGISRHITPNLKRQLKQSIIHFSQIKQKFKIIKNQGIIPYCLYHLRNRKPTIYDFRPSPALNNPENTVFIKWCCLQDLLCFDHTESFVSQQAFLSDALKRYELGEQSYTWVEDGKLLACAWLLGPNRSKKDKRTIIFPVGCAIIHGVYQHPQVGDRLGSFLHTVMLEASRLSDPVSIYAVVSDADAKRSKILSKSPIHQHTG